MSQSEQKTLLDTLFDDEWARANGYASNQTWKRAREETHEILHSLSLEHLLPNEILDMVDDYAQQLAEMRVRQCDTQTYLISIMLIKIHIWALFDHPEVTDEHIQVLLHTGVFYKLMYVFEVMDEIYSQRNWPTKRAKK